MSNHIMTTVPCQQQIIAEHLRNARKAAKLSQEEVALRAGLDRSYVSQIERGLKSPTLSTFCKICEVLGSEPAQIFAQRRIM